MYHSIAQEIQMPIGRHRGHLLGVCCSMPVGLQCAEIRWGRFSREAILPRSHWLHCAYPDWRVLQPFHSARLYECCRSNLRLYDIAIFIQGFFKSTFVQYGACLTELRLVQGFQVVNHPRFPESFCSKRRANDTRDSSRVSGSTSAMDRTVLYFSAASVIFSSSSSSLPCISKVLDRNRPSLLADSVNVSRRFIATSVLPSRRHKSAMASVAFEPFVPVVQLCSIVLRRLR